MREDVRLSADIYWSMLTHTSWMLPHLKILYLSQTCLPLPCQKVALQVGRDPCNRFARDLPAGAAVVYSNERALRPARPFPAAFAAAPAALFRRRRVSFAALYPLLSLTFGVSCGPLSLPLLAEIEQACGISHLLSFVFRQIYRHAEKDLKHVAYNKALIFLLFCMIQTEVSHHEQKSRGFLFLFLLYVVLSSDYIYS